TPLYSSAASDVYKINDYTNESDDYTRNRYRHNVLPFLKEEENQVHLRFLKFSQELKMGLDYIDSEVFRHMDDMFVDNSLDLNKFLRVDAYIQRRIINNILEGMYPDNLYLVNGNHIDEVLKIINSKKPNIKAFLPNGICIAREYDKLYFDCNEVQSSDYEERLVDELILPTGVIRRINESEEKSNYVIRLNSKDITLPIIVRNRRDGDKMQIKNMSGHKKINDIFIDSKINSASRASWPVVTDVKGVILWLPGLKKSNFDVPNDAEYDIILRYEKGEKINE
ncbi:MAG: tRNA lysidine(34) synthetase TilS, partial [Bacilli bacterium]|nr:tRNA lysidine(34) synthetase TilS [Bacilli bacterium]